MQLRFRRRPRNANLTMTTTMPIAPVEPKLAAPAAPPPPMPAVQPAAVVQAAPVAAVVKPATGAAQVGLNGHRHIPLKTQATGTDVRSERLFRQVRAEVQELRSSFSNLQVAGEEMSELDIAAVADNPEAAALLPSALLVRALIRSNESSEKLLRKLARARARSERLDAKLRDLRQERAYTRGRTETLDQVIAALHGNLEDLRAARDGQRSLAEVAGPRALRGAMAPVHEALPSPERA